MKQQVLIAISIFIIGCSSNDNSQNVGDISFDQLVDDKNFKICNENRIKQYYVRGSSDLPPSYKGEKIALDRAILKTYQFPIREEQNGYITIRFIVNCNGETGRFRVEEMDFNYKPKKFDTKITSQLLEIVRKLDGWAPRKSNNKNLDFYQYLTFKIEKGQIIKILP